MSKLLEMMTEVENSKLKVEEEVEDNPEIIRGISKKTGKPKKKVTWPTAGKLEQIRHIERLAKFSEVVFKLNSSWKISSWKLKLKWLEKNLIVVKLWRIYIENDIFKLKFKLKKVQVEKILIPNFSPERIKISTTHSWKNTKKKR